MTAKVIMVMLMLVSTMTRLETAAVSTTTKDYYTTTDWTAGYVYTGGPYTAVKGTFVVPNIHSEIPADEGLLEYIGIGTWSDQSFQGILVGVLVQMNPCSETVLSSPGPTQYLFCVFMFIGKPNTDPLFRADGGDPVTVEISKKGRSSYYVWTADVDTREAISPATETVSYNGPTPNVVWGVQTHINIAWANYPYRLTYRLPNLAPLAFRDLGLAPDRTQSIRSVALSQGKLYAAPFPTHNGFTIWISSV
jgi:hypothetical protein